MESPPFYCFKYTIYYERFQWLSKEEKTIFQKSQKNLKKGVDKKGSMWYYSKAVENGREKEETQEGKT